MKKIIIILREPLVHFLFIGLSLFFIYSQLNENVEVDETQVHITKSDLDSISKKFIDYKGREASKEEKKDLINKFIKEEIFYREALTKGLDKNDNTIRTHLAKKMQYVFDDLNFIKEPNEEELKKYLSNNKNMFIEPAQISFNQIVFTKTDNSKDIENESSEFLQKLQSKKSKKVSQIGDLVELSQKAVTKLFGLEFSDQIFNMLNGSWLRTIETKHGLHLVYIHSRTAERLPELSEIREKVISKYKQNQQKIANEKMYKNLLKNYQITID